MDERASESNQFPVRCEVCGRQDDTVRFVVYPFVFSFLVVTFQRAFSGCWCSLHRIQRWLAASFVTSIFGWFGIPFGIIFTPVRLLQLARGGVLDGRVNGQILRAIGDEKLNGRDTSGAIRCFEASLLYADDPDAREKLRKLYQTQRMSEVSAASGLIAVFSFAAIPATLFILGMIVGLIDNFLGWLASSFFQEYSIYLLILIQLPLVICIYFCVTALAYLLRAIIRSTGATSWALFSVSAILFPLTFVYAIIVGEVFAIYVGYTINGFGEPLAGALATLAAICTHAGFFLFSAESFRTNLMGNILFAALLSLSFVFALAVLLPIARENTRQQTRLHSLQQNADQTGQGYAAGGWVGILGFLTFMGFLFFMTPQKTSVDTLVAYNHISTGYLQLTSNQPEQAVVEYRKAVELKPDFALGHILLGNVYLSTGEKDKARESFEMATELAPNNPSGPSGLGWVYLQENNNELAAMKFQKALELDPQSPEGHLGLAWVYLNQEKLPESKNEFEAVIRIAPDIPDAHLGLGLLYYFENNFVQAHTSIDAALQLNPNYAEALFYQGKVYFSEEQYDHAQEIFLAVLKLQPAHYGALTGLGEVRVAKYDFDEGLRYFDRAYEIDPNRFDAPLDRASVLIQKGEFDQAIEITSLYVQADSTIRPTLAYMQFRNGMKDEGNRLLQESISSVDDLKGIQQARTYLAIAAVFSSINDFSNARQFIELATSQPVGMDANAYLLHATILSAMGEFDAAEKMLQSANEMGHSEYSLHLTRAQVLIDQEKLEDALQESDMALRLDSHSSRAHAARAYILFLQGRLFDSRDEATRAIELNPYNADARTTLAFVYQALGLTDKALVQAEESIRLDTLRSSSHYILGICYKDKGRDADAIAELETFLENYWDRAYIREYKVTAESYLAKLKPAP